MSAIADFITAFIDNAGENEMTLDELRMLWENEAKDEFIKLVEKNIKKITKTKKTKKDKDAPKGARNAYILYCMEERPKIKEEFPEMKNQDVVKEMAKRWNKIQDDEEALEYYRKLAVDDKERAAKEKGEYVPEEKPVETKTRKTSPRTKTGYQLFCDDERPSVKEDGFVGREIMVELGRRWKALPEEDEDRWQEYMSRAKMLKNKIPEETVEETEEEVVEEVVEEVEDEEEKPKKKKKSKNVKSEDEEKPKKKKKSKKIVESEDEEKPKKKKIKFEEEDDE